jgi:PAS domain S-box-containing protein
MLLPCAASLLIFELLRRGLASSGPGFFLLIFTPILISVPLLFLAASALRRMQRERHQSEEALRISTQRFSSVVASAMDAIITMDESQRVIVFNHAAEKMFGCPAWDAIGKPLDRFLPDSVRHSHAEHVRRFGEAGQTTRSMTSPAYLSARRINGETFPIEATISQVQVAGQKLFTVILRDITERRIAEQSLRQSEARFRSIYEQAAVGIEQVGFDGRLRMANAALCSMLGYEERELLGRSVGEITHHGDYSREIELVTAMLRRELNSYEMEKRYRHRDGSLVWVHATSSVVSDASGEPQYRISVLQNLTERKRVEDELRQAQKMEAIGRLAGGVAHDFNTLLNVMLGYSDLLLGELPVGDPRREHVEQIKVSGESAAQLTRQLLAFSRKQPIAEELLDLRDAASRIVPILNRLLRDDIELMVNCANEACPVKVDPGQIQQVVLNLAVNAADAMPNGGRLDLGVKTVEADEAYLVQHPMLQPGNYAVLSVADTGIGMDNDTVAHLFEPFFTTKPSGKGTGLGLATVYGIVKRNGGDIWVYSEPGSGSVFKVMLPLSHESLPPKETRKVTPQVASGSGETILLVEDSAALRELTKVILTRDGYHILEAEDGVAALEVARAYEGPIHLLLTDVVMPRMRGPQLAVELIRLRPSTAVVFLSGYTEEILSDSERLAGFILVEKPYTAQVLLSSIRRVLQEAVTKPHNS